MKHSCPICLEKVHIPEDALNLAHSIEEKSLILKDLFRKSEVVRTLTWQIDNEYELHNRQYFHNSPYLEIHNSIGCVMSDNQLLLFCPQHHHIFNESIKEYRASLFINQAKLKELNKTPILYKGEAEVRAYMDALANEIIKEMSSLIGLMESLQKLQYFKVLSQDYMNYQDRNDLWFKLRNKNNHKE